MLGISYREHKTNEYVWQQVSILAGSQELLLSTIKRRKLSWFGHVCSHDTLLTIILQGSATPWTEGVSEVDCISLGRATSRNGWAI